MKKKVLIVPTMVLPVPDTKGGAIERLLTVLIEENEKHGLCELFVLSVKEERAEKKAEGYRYTRIFYRKRSPFVLERLFMYAYVACRKLFGQRLPYFDPNYLGVPRLVKKISPDLVIMEGSGGENLLSVKKLVGREDCFLHLHHRFPPNRTLDEIYGTVISPSRFLLECWEEESHVLPVNRELVFNCIDEERFRDSDEDREYLRKREGFRKEDFILLFCGRIIPEKGVRELLSAFRHLPIKEKKLLVIGNAGFGNEIETSFYREMRKEMEKDPRIRSLGYVENEQMRNYYRMADVQLIPSLCDEAAGLVAIEGMATGLPIIASISGGLPEYTGDAAIFVPKEGPEEALVHALLRLYEDKELRENLSRRGRERAELFTKERYYFDYMKALGIKE